MIQTLFLFIVILFIGIVLGSKVLKKDKEYKWIGTLQMVGLVTLIFFMGVKIGADDRVIESIKTIGLKAFAISFFAILFSVLFLYIGRKALGFDQTGLRTKAKDPITDKVEGEVHD